MSLRRQEVLARARALFRTADYAAARLLIAEPTEGSPTEAAALGHLDAVCARLLNEKPRPGKIPKPDLTDPIADQAIYWEAFGRFLDDDYQVAHNLLRSHTPLTDYYRAAFPLLRGWLFGAAGQLPQQAAVTSQALSTLLSADAGDQYLIGNAALTLSGLAREMPSTEAHRLLEQSLSRIGGETAAYTLLHVRRALAQIEALHGRYPTALRHLTFAGEFARESVDRAFLHFDYALIATWAKQSAAAEAAFDVACAALENVDFATRTDESAYVLTVAAVAAAAIKPEAARAFAARAKVVIPELSLRWGQSHHARSSAFVDEAIALTTDDRDVVVELGTRAGETFERLGSMWRAGRLAERLYTLTGHVAYRRRAERLLEAYPNGPLTPSDDQVTLPPRLREILTMLNRGDSIDHIAFELDISPNTVRKHVTRLHARYGVTRRAQLLAKASSIAS